MCTPLVLAKKAQTLFNSGGVAGAWDTVKQLINVAESLGWCTRHSPYTEQDIKNLYDWVVSIGSDLVLCVGCGTGIHEYIIRLIFDEIAVQRGHVKLKFILTERATSEDKFFPTNGGGQLLPCVLKCTATEAIELHGTERTVVLAFRPSPDVTLGTGAPLAAAVKDMAFVYYGESPLRSSPPANFDKIAATFQQSPLTQIAIQQCKAEYQPGGWTARSDLSQPDMDELCRHWGMQHISDKGPECALYDRRFFCFQHSKPSTVQIPPETDSDIKKFIASYVDCVVKQATQLFGAM